MKIVTLDRSHRTLYSMRWAAWADALGFISELTTESGLRRRLHGKQLTEPVSWVRRIGGKFGVDMTLPAGCYSDDTQLRLATARAIRANGFDVEAFAKVELAAWPSYSLGGGRATKAAAANITKANTPWFANFHDGWLDAGGNGIAMRIQPHVWAASAPATVGPHILDVIVNGVTTHGHPRALVGAVLHALSLGYTLHDGHVPPPERWPELLDATAQAVNLINKHQQLASVWRPEWERRSKTSFNAAWHHTVDECLGMLPAATQAVKGLSGEGNSLSSSAATAYEDLISSLELRDPAKRGTGTTTALAALALAAAAPADPAGAARLAAQAIGTDTDTIATMAAALIGAAHTAPQDHTLHILDLQYLTAEAIRLCNIAEGRETRPFSYPDLLHWAPPRNQLDWVGLVGQDAALAGLCWLKSVEGSKPAEARGTKWQWTHSDFGPSFLVKQRTTLRELPKGNWPVRRDEIIDLQVRAHWLRSSRLPDQLSLDETIEERAASQQADNDAASESAQTKSGHPLASQPRPEPADIDQMLVWVARRRYSEEAIGYATRRIAQIGTVEQLVAFTTALRSAIRRSAE